MDRIAALKRTEMFGSLGVKELGIVADSCVEKKLKKGAVLISAGEEAKGLYVITTGTLRAYRENTNGREQIIHIERAGTTIAEVPVFDGKPYPSSVIAEEESEVLFISKQDIQRLISEFPPIALAALKLLASRLRKTSVLAESLSLKEVDQRLAAFLLEEFRDKRLKKLKLPSVSTIAARLGSVREVVSRSFAKLEKEGYISVDKERYAVLSDPQGLEKFSKK
ncbi:MAG TPA: Crp/Fnr family transcriptional regulator [bacterium]|nr:Crp/Fnr family transcriptional regulator [bacterium]